MTDYPAPSPVYLGPPAHSSGSNNKPIARIVIHSTVSPCEPGGARKIAAYFRSQSAGGSAHYVVDPGEVVQAAYDSVECWHAPPNQHSLGIEMCDMPIADSAKRWDDANHKAMLDRVARLTAELCLAYDVPPVFLSASDLRAGKKGVTTHANVSEAFKQSTHWDPGAWPVEAFMALVREHVADLSAPKPAPHHHAKPATLNGGTWNLRQGRDPEKVIEEVVDFLHFQDLDFLCVQEAAQYLNRKMRRALRADGYDLVRMWAPDRSARDSGVIARKSRNPRAPRLHRLGGLGWERGQGRKGLHWPRSAQSLRVGWLRVLAVHQAPGPFGAKFPQRRAANVRGYDVAARVLNRWTKRGTAWVAPGDWNRHPSDPVVKAFVAATGADVTGDGIDWIASHGVTVSDVKRHKYGTSDHDPVTFTASKEN